MGGSEGYYNLLVETSLKLGTRDKKQLIGTGDKKQLLGTRDRKQLLGTETKISF